MFKVLGHAPVPQQQVPAVVAFLTTAHETVNTIRRAWSLFTDSPYATALISRLNTFDQKLLELKEAVERLAPINLTSVAANLFSVDMRSHVEEIAKEVIGLYAFVLQNGSKENEEQTTNALDEISKLERTLVYEEAPLYNGICSFRDLHQTAPYTLLPIYLAPFLRPENIPYDLLPESDNALGDKLHFLFIRGLLYAGSQPDTFSVHPLIQKMVEDYLSPQGKAEILNFLYDRLNTVWDFDRGNTRALARTEILLQHVMALVKATPEGPLSEKKAKYLNQLGSYCAAVAIALRNKMNYSRDTTTEQFEAQGEQQHHVAQSLNQLAADFATTEDFKQALEYHNEALEYHKEALAIYLKIHGPNHLTVAETYDHLGTLQLTLGSWGESEQYYRQALESYIAYYQGDKNKHVVAKCYTNLGNVALEQAHYEDARAQHNSALEILTLCSNQNKEIIPPPEFVYLHSSLHGLNLMLGAYNQASVHSSQEQHYYCMMLLEASGDENLRRKA